MIISPKTAIQNGWIKLPEHWSQDFIESKIISPNGLDFTVDSLSWIDKETFAVIREDKKSSIYRKQQRMIPMPTPMPRTHSSTDTNHEDSTGWFLHKNNTYDATSDIYVNIPEGYAGLLFTRSTLVRNGLFVTSGLFDSGYKGHLGVFIHNIYGDTYLEAGIRIGQMILVTADSAKSYAGDYNSIQGEHWSEKYSNQSSGTVGDPQ